MVMMIFEKLFNVILYLFLKFQLTMLEIFEDFVEASRNLTIWPIVIILPLILLVTPACASREFPVFRLQGFESSGFKNG